MPWNSLLLLAIVCLGLSSHAFVPPRPPPRPPPRGPCHQSVHHHDNPDEDSTHNHLVVVAAASWNTTSTNRGGGGDILLATENVVKGTQATLSSTANYWAQTFQSLSANISQPFKAAATKVKSIFQSKEKKREQELLYQLQTMPVQRVTVEGSTVLPNDVLQLAAKRSGVLGSPLRMDKVQDLAQSLKRWYTRKGYVLHSVTGATLRPETATAEITVQEPTISPAPVGITFCKEMVVDNETGELISFRDYKDRHVQRRTFGYNRISKAGLNTTYVPTSGRTNPKRIASALDLKPGRPFRWDGGRWRNIVSSGIFAQILRASPQPMGDGTVQLQIVATEAPPRHLEYGVGRSLYTGSWEGELDFEHTNLLGGGETLGLTVKRGAKDSMPSIRVSFSDGKFGMAGGYDVQAFSDFLGASTVSDSPNKTQGESQPPEDFDTDPLRNRRGLLFRVRNPVTQKLMHNSVATVSAERTLTKNGLHESIGSANLAFGPFVRQLPFDARSNVDASCTIGTRVADVESKDIVDGEGRETEKKDSSLLAGKTLLPYTSVTATTKQIFPLMTMGGEGRRPVVLVLRHSITASTKNLPRHEATAQGTTSSIRGSEPNGRVSSCLRGTTELRVPVSIPLKQLGQDGNIVFFSDWVLAAKDTASPLFRKSSVGFGLRKTIQGIPLQVDLTYSKEVKLKTSFGLGRDFDV